MGGGEAGCTFAAALGEKMTWGRGLKNKHLFYYNFILNYYLIFLPFLLII